MKCPCEPLRPGGNGISPTCPRLKTCRRSNSRRRERSWTRKRHAGNKPSKAFCHRLELRAKWPKAPVVVTGGCHSSVSPRSRNVTTARHRTGQRPHQTSTGMAGKKPIASVADQTGEDLDVRQVLDRSRRVGVFDDDDLQLVLQAGEMLVELLGEACRLQRLLVVRQIAVL